MRRCPTCGEAFNPPLMLCPRDSSVLDDELAGVPFDPLVGRVFNGRFAIEARLGEGGMGTVYRAVQLSVGREVALKVLRDSFSGRSDSAQRFAREARLLSRLHHPAVVTLFDFGQAETGEMFLAMELLQGETLSARLERGPFPPEEAARVCQAIAEALAVAHAAGIIHRDLKPDNVWISAPAEPTFAGEPGGERLPPKPIEQRIKVLDFGLARSVSVETTTLTSPGVLFGTPSYMAPEVIAGKSVGPTADLYALGAIFYELLCGAKVFERPAIEAVFAAHLFDAPPALPPSVPKPLAEIVRRLLSKDPEERPASANELRVALTAALEASDPGRARTDSHSVVPTSTARARRRLTWLFVVAGVLAAGGVGWGMSRCDGGATGVLAGAPEVVLVGFEPDSHELANVTPDVASETTIDSPDAAVAVAAEVAPAVAPDTSPEVGAEVGPDDAHAADVDPAPATVRLRITASPSADVTLDGKMLGRTPLAVEVARAAEGTLRFTRAGHRPQTKKIGLEQDQAVRVQLAPLDDEGFIVPDARP